MPGPRAIFMATLLAMAAPATAESLLASRTIRAQTVLGAKDIARGAADLPGGISDPAQVIGMEARVTLYAGRPILAGDIGPPALIERNQIVTLVFASPALRIETEARALARAAAGEHLRVLNLGSRSTVGGIVQPDGTVLVKGR